MEYIKNKLFKTLFVLTILSVTLLLSGCKKDNGLTKIRLAEVTHSVFYAPQYIALHNGYFEEYGIDLEIVNTNGADKTMAALLSNDCQIGLMGTEASIYVYNEGQKNYSKCFMQLTRCDGSFIVGRNKIENFTFDIFKNTEILGGRIGGMPLMCLEYVLKTNGVKMGRDDANSQCNVRTDVAFQAQAGSFISGEADFTTLFEPTATQLENNKQGYIICSVGEFIEEIPYTVYSCLNDYYNDNKDLLVNFTKAIIKAIDFMENNTFEESAKILKKSFPDSSVKDLEKVLKNYTEIDAWNKDGYLKLEGFNLLMDIMEEANELDKRAPYDKIVTNEIMDIVTRK